MAVQTHCISLLALGLFCEVARKQECLLTCIFYSFLADLSIFVLIQVGDSNMCALSCKGQSNGAPYDRANSSKTSKGKA